MVERSEKTQDLALQLSQVFYKNGRILKRRSKNMVAEDLGIVMPGYYRQVEHIRSAWKKRGWVTLAGYETIIITWRGYRVVEGEEAKRVAR